jgi:site-specific DNA recombinase
VRQKHVRHRLTHDDAGVRSERARRPAYLLSNLIKCSVCGGGFSKVSAHHYGCSNARNRGTCNNRLTIRRDVLEASVVLGLKTHLMQPELVKEFAAEYHRELNRLNGAREGAYAQQREELARVERQIRAVIEAIKDGMRTPGMKDELLALEARKSALTAEVKQAPEPAPRLHPRRADIYRDKVERLQESLNADATRAEAAEALRGLVEEVRLVPEDARMVNSRSSSRAISPAFWRSRQSTRSPKPVTAERDGLQVTVVAGVGFEPTTFRL